MTRLHGKARARAVVVDMAYLAALAGTLGTAGFLAVDRRDFAVGAALGILGGALWVFWALRRWGRLVGVHIHLDRWGPIEQAAFLAEIHPDADALVEAQHAEYLEQLSGEHELSRVPRGRFFGFHVEAWS